MAHHATIIALIMALTASFACQAVAGRAAPERPEHWCGGFAYEHIAQLTDATFNATVLESPDPWIIAFHAPWNGWCWMLGQEFKAAAARMAEHDTARGDTAHPTRVRFGAVCSFPDENNGGEPNALAQAYHVPGYPDIRLFSADKAAPPVPYNGDRVADSLFDLALQLWRNETSAAV